MRTKDTVVGSTVQENWEAELDNLINIAKRLKKCDANEEKKSTYQLLDKIMDCLQELDHILPYSDMQDYHYSRDLVNRGRHWNDDGEDMANAG